MASSVTTASPATRTRISISTRGATSTAKSSSRSTSPRCCAASSAASGWQRESVTLGTSTDPYQRAEGRYRLMPGIIDALADSRTPFSILTKRDAAAARPAAAAECCVARSPVSIAMSIAMPDEALRQTLEGRRPHFSGAARHGARGDGCRVRRHRVPHADRAAPHRLRGRPRRRARPNRGIRSPARRLRRAAPAPGSKGVVLGPSLELDIRSSSRRIAGSTPEHPRTRRPATGSGSRRRSGLRLLRRHRLGGGAEEEVETRPRPAWAGADRRAGQRRRASVSRRHGCSDGRFAGSHPVRRSGIADATSAHRRGSAMVQARIGRAQLGDRRGLDQCGGLRIDKTAPRG